MVEILVICELVITGLELELCSARTPESAWSPVGGVSKVHLVTRRGY